MEDDGAQDGVAAGVEPHGVAPVSRAFRARLAKKQARSRRRRAAALERMTATGDAKDGDVSGQSEYLAEKEQELERLEHEEAEKAWLERERIAQAEFAEKQRRQHLEDERRRERRAALETHIRLFGDEEEDDPVAAALRGLDQSEVVPWNPPAPVVPGAAMGIAVGEAVGDVRCSSGVQTVAAAALRSSSTTTAAVAAALHGERKVGDSGHFARSVEPHSVAQDGRRGPAMGTMSRVVLHYDRSLVDFGGAHLDPANWTGVECCPFFMKTGACRFGMTCSRAHPRPVCSPTLLLRNMFDHYSRIGGRAGLSGARGGASGVAAFFGGNGAAGTASSAGGGRHGGARAAGLRRSGGGGGGGGSGDEDLDMALTPEQLRRLFRCFFHDVHSELAKFGRILNFRVCENTARHLCGNVYVHYASVQEALVAFDSLSGRWFGGTQLDVQFVAITDWRVPICGMAMRGICPRGGECNYLHVLRNPNDMYGIYGLQALSDSHFRAAGAALVADGRRGDSQRSQQWQSAVRSSTEIPRGGSVREVNRVLSAADAESNSPQTGARATNEMQAARDGSSSSHRRRHHREEDVADERPHRRSRRREERHSDGKSAREATHR